MTTKRSVNPSWRKQTQKSPAIPSISPNSNLSLKNTSEDITKPHKGKAFRQNMRIHFRN